MSGVEKSVVSWSQDCTPSVMGLFPGRNPPLFLILILYTFSTR